MWQGTTTFCWGNSHLHHLNIELWRLHKNFSYPEGGLLPAGWWEPFQHCNINLVWTLSRNSSQVQFKCEFIFRTINVESYVLILCVHTRENASYTLSLWEVQGEKTFSIIAPFLQNGLIAELQTIVTFLSFYEGSENSAGFSEILDLFVLIAHSILKRRLIKFVSDFKPLVFLHYMFDWIAFWYVYVLLPALLFYCV